jgi:serine/threonine protein kinase/Flp pilus assembly protein TadD
MSRWLQVCEVFAEVRELPRESWTPRLAERCDGDPALATEVRSLLEADLQAGGFLEEPPTLQAPANEPEPESRRLGPYRLLRRLGRGGMGSVWLARREDDAFTKRVAVKVLQKGMVREETLERFRTERQILAGLDHPYIARVLDGGSTPQGRPYLVMEYVEGTRVDRYCAEHGLGLRERLALFRKICSAVHFAHQNLVVHRDLKPSNILITPDGTPKLLDFGIAKLLNPELAVAPSSPTTATLLLLTPEYASPEQARGGPITTASDVYSLGALLYRLLTGALPHPARDRSPVELLRSVCEDEPRRPSLRVTPDVASEASMSPPAPPPIPARRLSGDLDNVVLKALAKEPRQRYLSAEQLSEDLQRFLDDRPVLARNGTWTYRLGKLVRRRRWEVAGLAAVLVLALGVTITLAAQQAALSRAQRSTEHLTTFLVDLFESSDPLNGGQEDMSVRELHERGAEQLAGRLSHEPELRADLQQTLGEIYMRLNENEPALSLLEASLETRRKLDPPAPREVARSLTALGHLRIQRGELELAEKALQEGLDLRRQELGEDHEETADSFDELGLLRQVQERFDEAAALYRRALSIWQDGGQGSPAEIARVLNNLATARTLQGELEEAERLHREALPLRSHEYGPGSAEVSETLHNLAYLLWLQGRWTEARPLAERALVTRRRVLGDDHPRTAHSLAVLGVILEDLGEPAKAENLQREALAIHRRLARGKPTRAVAKALHSVGLTLEAQGRLGEAEALFAEAVAQLDRVLTEGQATGGRLRASLARVLADLDRFSEGEVLARDAIEKLRQSLGPEHAETARAESVLAGCLVQQGETAEAQGLLHHALRVFDRSPDRRSRKWRRRAEATLARLESPDLAAAHVSGGARPLGSPLGRPVR